MDTLDMSQIPEEIKNKIPEDLMNQVTPELLEQAKQCETQEEAIALLTENGIEIPDEALENVAGGYWGGGGAGCDCDWYHF